MPCIYVLKSEANHKLYIGSTREDEPNTRIISHNKGRVRSTKSGRPWKLVYTEKQTTYTEARKRELFLKSGVGRKLIKTSLLK